MNKSSKKFGGLLLTTSLACIGFAFDGTGGIMTQTAAKMLSSITSRFAATNFSFFNYSRLKSWIVTEDPDNLNHDLQKAIKAATLQAFDNVYYLYSKQNPDADGLKKVKQKFKILKKNYDTTFQPNSSNTYKDDAISKLLYDDPEEALKQLFSRIESYFKEYPQVNSFIQKHLVQQIQLCFGEVIKDPDNEKAWRAFQRLLTEEMRADIKNVLQRQDRIENKLDNQREVPVIDLSNLTPEQIGELKVLLKKLEKPGIENKIRSALDEALNDIKKEIHEILKITGETRDTVLRIEDILLDKNYSIEAILVTHWYSKKVVALGASASSLLVLVLFLGFYFYLQPFSITVTVHGIEGRNHLPLQNKGSLQLSIGDYRQTSDINAKGEVYFHEIPAKYKGEKVLFDIVNTQDEPYNPIYPDSTYQLESGKPLFIAAKLEGLDKMYGIVKDFRTGNPINDTRIVIQGEETFSDEYGHFNLTLPLEKQKQFQTIRAFKQGYQSFELSNVPAQTDREIAVLMKPVQQ